VNPGLLYTPKQAGGVGLVSIAIACKTQRVKQTMLWLIQRRDTYFQAWKAWMWRGVAADRFRVTALKVATRGACNISTQEPGVKPRRLLGDWLGDAAVGTLGEQQHYQRQISKLEVGAISWSSKEEWTIELPVDPVSIQTAAADDAGEFWATYSWENNEYIRDKVGKVLTRREYNRIRPCALEDLQISRTAVNMYTMVVPTEDGRIHRQYKMR
jgi:hypothetical protein